MDSFGYEAGRGRRDVFRVDGRRVVYDPEYQHTHTTTEVRH